MRFRLFNFKLFPGLYIVLIKKITDHVHVQVIIVNPQKCCILAIYVILYKCIFSPNKGGPFKPTTILTFTAMHLLNKMYSTARFLRFPNIYQRLGPCFKATMPKQSYKSYQPYPKAPDNLFSSHIHKQDHNFKAAGAGLSSGFLNLPFSKSV